MKIYRVGGAVRDKQLGLPLTEHDWVVVGATAEELLAKGYLCVGKDFPVFLHPLTNDEYALARTERKSGRGYTGFTFDSTPSVTLEADLARRDLTINAIAEDEQGQLYDPYQGLDDLKHKVLRHVSPAFAEDPVRILRLARFSARFAHLGFSIAAETKALMRQMVDAGEVDALVAERVWQELHKALTEQTPALFFHVLNDCGALTILFPALAEHHAAAMCHLVKAANSSADPKVRFAALVNALSMTDIQRLCVRSRVPKEYQELALLTKKEITIITKVLTPESILHFLETTDAFRRSDRWQALITILTILGLSDKQKQLLQRAFAIAKKSKLNTTAIKNLSGVIIGEKIHAARLAAIEKHPFQIIG